MNLVLKADPTATSVVKCRTKVCVENFPYRQLVKYFLFEIIIIFIVVLQLMNYLYYCLQLLEDGLLLYSMNHLIKCIFMRKKN